VINKFCAYSPAGRTLHEGASTAEEMAIDQPVETVVAPDGTICVADRVNSPGGIQPANGEIQGSPLRCGPYCTLWSHLGFSSDFFIRRKKLDWRRSRGCTIG
jgi:hypothetical protein